MITRWLFSERHQKYELVAKIWRKSKILEPFWKSISFLITATLNTGNSNLFLGTIRSKLYGYVYSFSSTVGLAQQWDQLDQLGMRMQHNLEQQIQARNQSGVSEDALKEFSMMFK